MNTATETSGRLHALYRFFGSDGALLYVGITMDPSKRWLKHSRGKPWWAEVTRIDVEVMPDRDSALKAERTAILEEHPRHNVLHNRVRVTSKFVDTYTATDMPDECYDHCRPVYGVETQDPQHAGIVYPHLWVDGLAFYECPQGHRWSCSWVHGASGSDASRRGVRVPYDKADGNDGWLSSLESMLTTAAKAG